MATQLISFRVSGELLDWLEAERLEGESLNLAAQRVFKQAASFGVDKTVRPVDRSVYNNVDIEQLVTEKVEKAEERLAEKLGGFEERLKKLRA